jgi:hypothetical protein
MCPSPHTDGAKISILLTLPPRFYFILNAQVASFFVVVRVVILVEQVVNLKNIKVSAMYTKLECEINNNNHPVKKRINLVQSKQYLVR